MAPPDGRVEGGGDARGGPDGSKVPPLPPRAELGIGPGDDPGPVLPDGEADEDERPLQPAGQRGDGGQHDRHGLAGRRGQLGALEDVDAVEDGLGLGDARPGRHRPDGHGNVGQQGRQDAGHHPPPKAVPVHEGLVGLLTQRVPQLDVEERFRRHVDDESDGRHGHADAHQGEPGQELHVAQVGPAELSSRSGGRRCGRFRLDGLAVIDAVVQTCRTDLSRVAPPLHRPPCPRRGNPRRRTGSPWRPRRCSRPPKSPVRDSTGSTGRTPTALGGPSCDRSRPPCRSARS